MYWCHNDVIIISTVLYLINCTGNSFLHLVMCIGIECSIVPGCCKKLVLSATSLLRCCLAKSQTGRDLTSTTTFMGVIQQRNRVWRLCHVNFMPKTPIPTGKCTYVLHKLYYPVGIQLCCLHITLCQLELWCKGLSKAEQYLKLKIGIYSVGYSTVEFWQQPWMTRPSFYFLLLHMVHCFMYV